MLRSVGGNTDAATAVCRSLYICACASAAAATTTNIAFQPCISVFLLCSLGGRRMRRPGLRFYRLEFRQSVLRDVVERFIDGDVHDAVVGIDPAVMIQECIFVFAHLFQIQTRVYVKSGFDTRAKRGWRLALQARLRRP